MVMFQSPFVKEFGLWSFQLYGVVYDYKAHSAKLQILIDVLSRHKYENGWSATDLNTKIWCASDLRH